MSVPIPKIIFIVPYRDRQAHLDEFKKHMKTVMEDYAPEDYKYMFIHQCDTRKFNRGAMKNIGFIAASRLYPDHYLDITFVFNDVDSMPVKKNVLDYQTTPNVIKHFYGFKYTLGGIVSILGRDFVRIGGFPNFWGWGYEDNMLQMRAEGANIAIDRSVFFPINDFQNIIQLTHGNMREMNLHDFNKFNKKTKEGLFTIYLLNYTIDDANDFINVSDFKTSYEENKLTTFVHDLNNGNKPLRKSRGNPTMLMNFLS